MDLHLLMVRYILGNGIKKKTVRKAMGCKYGLMAVNMKVFGKKIWLTATADLFWLMVMYLKATGSMIKHMDWVTIIMKRVQLIKDNG